MIWWGSVALAYNVQRSGFRCQQHTDPPIEYGWVPVYTDMPSLGKRVSHMMKLNCGHRVEAV